MDQEIMAFLLKNDMEQWGLFVGIFLGVFIIALLIAFVLCKRRKGQKTTDRPLMVLLFAAPFCMGLYHIWTSAFAIVYLGIYLCCQAAEKGKLHIPWNMTLAAVCSIPVMLLLGVLWAVDRGGALFGFVKFLPMPLFLLAVSQIEKERRNRLLDMVPYGGILMVILSALLQLVPQLRDFFQVNGRLAGFFQYPNTFAIYLLCGMIILVIRKRAAWQKAAGAFVLAMGILLSGSRTTAALMAAVILIFLIKKCTKKQRLAVLGGLCGMLALFTAVLYLTGNTQLLARYFISPMKSSTFLGRLLYAWDLVPVLLRHPLGLGYQGYYFLQGSFQSGVYSTRFVHNELLQLLADAGWIPGILISISALKALRYGDFERRLVLAVLLAHSLFDFDFQFLATGFLLLLLLDAEGSDRTKHHPKRGILKWKAASVRSTVSVLTALGVCIGMADFAFYMKKAELALRLYPIHTESLLALLTQSGDAEAMELVADCILEHNKKVSLAYSAKANAAFAAGDGEKMIEYKKQAIALSVYAKEEYEDYAAKLLVYMQLYMDSGMEESAEYCRQMLLEIPELLSGAEQNTSYLGWHIYDQPDLELSDEYLEAIEYLRQSEHH